MYDACRIVLTSGHVHNLRTATHGAGPDQTEDVRAKFSAIRQCQVHDKWRDCRLGYRDIDLVECSIDLSGCEALAQSWYSLE